MTDRIYMQDCYQEQVSTTIEDVTNATVVLASTIFYPEGGGQPSDHGVIETGDTAVEVTDVEVRDGEVHHIVDTVDPFETGMSVEASIDWERRHRLMRMHTAQHLVSAVVLDQYDAETVGNQIHREYSRIDFKPVDFDAEDIEKIERQCNSLIEEERDVSIYEEARDTLVEKLPVGRSDLSLIPDHIDPLRVVEIEDLDICPCGGTHVDNLDEIGSISIDERQSKGQDTDRLIFSIDA